MVIGEYPTLDPKTTLHPRFAELTRLVDITLSHLGTSVVAQAQEGRRSNSLEVGQRPQRCLQEPSEVLSLLLGRR